MRGDFIGFSFNGVHSEELGLLRVTNGDRYNMSLSPSFNDITKADENNGNNFYFGTVITDRKIQLQLAYANISEKQIRQIKKVFSPLQSGDLIFDETPYKRIRCKVSNDTQLQFLCFDEVSSTGENIRVYRGEITLDFISFEGFYRSLPNKKYIEDFPKYLYPNVNEWIEGSGLKNKGNLDYYLTSAKKFILYNGGDYETDYVLTIPFSDGEIPSLTIQIGSEAIKLKKIIQKNNDIAIQISSKTNLIEGINNNGEVTVSYNEYKIGGYFFKIPASEENIEMIFTGEYSPSLEKIPTIKYDYLYL